MNPWLALPDGAPTAVVTRRLRAAHEALVTRGGRPATGRHVRPVVWDSWRRSLGNGVDPDGVPAPVDLLDDDLVAYREAHPLAAVMPVIRRLLVADAEADKMIVAVTDAAGRMLWVEGDRQLRSQAERMHFVAGSRWGEDVVGHQRPRHRPGAGHPGADLRQRALQPDRCSRGAARPPRCTTR